MGKSRRSSVGSRSSSKGRRSRTRRTESSSPHEDGSYGSRSTSGGRSASTRTTSSQSDLQDTVKGSLSLDNGMSHAQAAQLVEEMMLKQIEIAQRTASMLQELSPSVDDVAESQALASQQEAISQTFANMVHTMIEQLRRQEMELEEKTQAHTRLERHATRVSEALEFKTSQVKTLEGRVESQQEELVGLYKDDTKGKEQSKASSKGKEPAAGSEKLRERLKQKSDELRKVKSKLNDCQFLLQAYKERCENMESKTAKKSTFLPFRSSGRKEDPLHSSMPSVLTLNGPGAGNNHRAACDESVDMSLYCL